MADVKEKKQTFMLKKRESGCIDSLIEKSSDRLGNNAVSSGGLIWGLSGRKRNDLTLRLSGGR